MNDSEQQNGPSNGVESGVWLGDSRPFGCKCQSLAHRILGDGCDECNPELAAEIKAENEADMLTVDEMEREDIAERPYEVYHPWAETKGPKFKTWPEARNAAKEWNREIPGHVARKRRFFASPPTP